MPVPQRETTAIKETVPPNSRAKLSGDVIKQVVRGAVVREFVVMAGPVVAVAYRVEAEERLFSYRMKQVVAKARVAFRPPLRP